MDVEKDARLEEVADNIRITKKQIRKVKEGKISLPSGNHVVEGTNNSILCILEGQLHDLMIQQAHIKKEIEKENQQK